MPRFSECWRCGSSIGVGILCQLCEVAKYCSEKCQKDDIFRHEAECMPASILKSCAACTKSGSNLRACTGCYRAFYCDANCQKGNWKRHESDCLKVDNNIREITGRILARFIERPEATASSCAYVYWGNVPAFDCLNLAENEGPTYHSALKVLILGVGDLRNVALTCASLPDSYENKILFTINDRESCVLARLVLLLYMLSKSGLEMEKTVTEIWYSILLSEATYKYLRTSLEELVNFRSAENLQSKTVGLISVDENQFKQLQDVWKTWLGLRVQGTVWIQGQRRKAYSERFLNILSGYIMNIPTEHVESARKWIDDGVFERTQTPAFAENPTLTGVNQLTTKYSYCIQPLAMPFLAWDYVQVKKFKSSDCLVTMYGEYIECILKNFMEKVTKQQISFKIVQCDCVNIKQHFEVDTMYDRILTSNLMDYIFLPDLLKLCSEMLNHDSRHATIVTETLTWCEINPEGEFSSCTNDLQARLAEMAMEDLKRSSFVNNGGLPIPEYLDNSCQFVDYLRAIFFANISRAAKEHQSTKHKTRRLPVTKMLGNEFQLRLRDGTRDENRIVFFRPAITRRIVTVAKQERRNLEWVPLKQQ